MKNPSFIFFTITYEIQITLNSDNFLNNDFRKRLILFLEITSKSLPFTKVSLKLSGSSISEKDPPLLNPVED